jgi:hypothetical protein
MTLSEAVDLFEKRLPGWWWSVGNCSVSADASCGPDRAGPDAGLLEHRLFDGGFHCDARQPANVVDSLMDVMQQALDAKLRFSA